MSDTTTPPPLPDGAATAQLQTTLNNSVGFQGAPAWNGTDAKTNVLAVLKRMSGALDALSSAQSACATTLAAIQAALAPQQQNNNQPVAPPPSGPTESP